MYGFRFAGRTVSLQQWSVFSDNDFLVYKYRGHVALFIMVAKDSDAIPPEGMQVACI